MNALAEWIEKLMGWLQRKPWATFLAICITFNAMQYRQGITDRIAWDVERKDKQKTTDALTEGRIKDNQLLAVAYRQILDLTLDNKQLRDDTARLNSKKP